MDTSPYFAKFLITLLWVLPACPIARALFTTLNMCFHWLQMWIIIPSRGARLTQLNTSYNRGHNWNQVSISSTQDVFPLTSTVKNYFIARCNADASYTVVTIENIDQLAFLPLNSSGRRNLDPKRCSVGTILTTNTFNIIGNSCCIMIKVLLWY